MTQYLFSTVDTTKSVLHSVLQVAWERLPPDKASALSEFGSEWADENNSKWRVEFWKRHATNVLWPSSLLQLLGTLGAISGGIWAVSFLGCLLLISASLASLGVAAIVSVASFACTLMAAAAFFPLMITAALSGVSAGACVTGGVALFATHAALQRMHLAPVQLQHTRRIKATDGRATTSPLGFPTNEQHKSTEQADLIMKPLGGADMPVSDVSADLHLLHKRPPRVATATDSTPSLAFGGGASSREQWEACGSSTTGFAADAGSSPGVEEGPEAVSGYTDAAAEPAPPPPVPPGVADCSDEAAPPSQTPSTTMLDASSTATVGVSPMSARSTGMDSAAASDSVVSRESWATRGARGPSAEHDLAQDGAGAAAGTEKLSVGMLQAAPAVRQRRVKQGGRQTPPPAPSDVSSSGQASVMDIMDQRFMGGM